MGVIMMGRRRLTRPRDSEDGPKRGQTPLVKHYRSNTAGQKTLLVKHYWSNTTGQTQLDKALGRLARIPRERREAVGPESEKREREEGGGRE